MLYDAAMHLTLIYACADNGVIGRDGRLPWRLPDDFKHFKATTLGHPIIMGRVTFEQDTGLLPGRTNIVLSSDPEARARAEAKGAVAAATLEEALAPYQDSDEEVFIIGGARLYESAFPMADRIWRTCVHASPEGDTFLTAWDLTDWQLVESRAHDADERHVHAFTIERLDRVKK